MADESRSKTDERASGGATPKTTGKMQQRKSSTPSAAAAKSQSKKITEFFNPNPTPSSKFYEAESPPTTKQRPGPKSSKVASTSKMTTAKPRSKSKSRSTGTDSESVVSEDTDTRSSRSSVVRDADTVSTSKSSDRSSGATPSGSKPGVGRPKSRKARAPQPPSRRAPDDITGLVVEAILDRWDGESDYNRTDTFYLPKFKGYDAPAWGDNDAWKHVSLFKDPATLEMIRECNERKEKEAEAKRLQREKRSQAKWAYVDDDDIIVEEDRVKLLTEQAAKEALEDKNDGQPKVPKTRPIKPKILELNGEESSKGGVSKAAKKINEVPAQPYGFERCLSAESIIGAHVYRNELVYQIKFKGSDRPEFVTEGECRQKCPNLVIKFLEEGLLRALNEKF